MILLRLRLEVTMTLIFMILQALDSYQGSQKLNHFAFGRTGPAYCLGGSAFLVVRSTKIFRDKSQLELFCMHLADHRFARRDNQVSRFCRCLNCP